MASGLPSPERIEPKRFLEIYGSVCRDILLEREIENYDLRRVSEWENSDLGKADRAQLGIKVAELFPDPFYSSGLYRAEVLSAKANSQERLALAARLSWQEDRHV